MPKREATSKGSSIRRRHEGSSQFHSPTHAEADQKQVNLNISLHDRIAGKYDRLHGEIFNDIEQERLARTLEFARDAIQSDSSPMRALDFGCGSGNLTKHLLALGFEVTAADVSSKLLELVRSRYPAATTVLLDGRDSFDFNVNRFDLVATYSVLHHIPDYLSAMRDLARAAKPGGVVFIDHEQNEHFWNRDNAYQEFLSKALRFDWRKYLRPINYVHRARRMFNFRYSNEGDIHVWPDDHIEWKSIKDTMKRAGFNVVAELDYLLYRELYRRDVYERYAERCTDTKAMIFRKPRR